MLRWLSLGILAQCLLPAPAAGQARRAMTVDDALRIVQVGDPLLSPDGSLLLFSQRAVDWEANVWKTTWWAAPAAGGAARPFLQDPSPSEVAFSPTGRLLSFQRSVDGKSQILLLPLTGGEARQLTHHPTSIETHEWAGDGSSIVFLAPDSVPAEVTAGDDAYFVDEGANTELPGVRKNLWQLDVEQGMTRRLTSLDMHIFEFEVSPHGDQVVLVGRHSSNRNDIDQNEIWLLDVASGGLRQLTEDGAVEDRLRWTPDGAQVSWMADDSLAWTHKEDKIWSLDLRTGRRRLLSGSFQGRISRYWWSPDGAHIRFTALNRTDTNLYELDVESGGVRALTTVTGDFDVTALSADHSVMAYTLSDYRTPPDVFTSPVGGQEPHRFTDANPWVRSELELASMDVVRWNSRDGREIEGLVHRPATGAGPYPLILSIHGGPPGFWDNTWAPQPHIYAGLGYALLSPNVRGSAGYGDDLREANTFYNGDGIGYGDFDDLMTGLDYVIAEGVADPDRLGVRGWSYGAILGGFALTRTNRFKAAALGAGVYDWSAEFGMGYNWDVTRWYIGGDPWSERSAWEEQSALTHADRISTPVMLFHGVEDHTTSEPQSMMLYGALRGLGRAPVRYLRVPREPHGFREPRHIRRQLIEEVGWMERWLKSADGPAR